MLQKQDDKYVLKFHSINYLNSKEESKCTHSPIIKIATVLVRPVATGKEEQKKEILVLSPSVVECLINHKILNNCHSLQTIWLCIWSTRHRRVPRFTILWPSPYPREKRKSELYLIGSISKARLVHFAPSVLFVSCVFRHPNRVLVSVAGPFFFKAGKCVV